MTTSHATTGGIRNRRPLRNATRSRLYAFALLAPAIIVVLLVIVYPLFMAGQLSLHDVRIFRADRGLTGDVSFDNFRDMFDNPAFWRSLRITLYYVAFGVVGSFGIGLFTAVLLNQPFKGRALARVLMVLPWPIPGVVAATIFIWMFNSSFGVINYLLLRTGIVDQPVQWFTQAVPALIAVVAATIWKGYPFFTISLLAGMQSVPKELYEAARVDGASAWARFRHITLPMISPVIFYNLVLAVIGLMRYFEVPFILSNGTGRPGDSTMFFNIHFYKTSFVFFDMGYGSALAWLLFVITMVFTGLLFYSARYWVFYAAGEVR